MTSVLFECHHLYYLPHFTPIIHVLKQRGGYSVSASIPKTVAVREQLLFAEAVAKLDVELFTAGDEATRVDLLAAQKFDVVVAGNIGKLEEIVADHSVAVMVYHGIGVKMSYYRDMSARVDIRAVECEQRFRELQNRGETSIVLTGLTKLDPLADGSVGASEKILEECGFSPELPTILYAPTFYPSSLEKLLPEIPGLTQDMNIIIKLHNFSWHQKRYRFQSEEAMRVTERDENIYLVPPDGFDILPYYAAAEILISDISSTLFEYLALDRPIIQTMFSSPRLRHRFFPWRLSSRIDEARTAEIDFTHRLAEPENLEVTLRIVLNNPGMMSKTRQRSAEKFLYKLDGRASHRLVDAVETKLTEWNRL